MTLRFLLARFALLLVSVPALAVPAFTEPVTTAPPAADLARLNDTLRPSTTVRLTVPETRFTCTHVRLVEDGVHFEEPFRFGTAESALPRSPLPWSDVRRLEAGHTSAAKGAIVGLLFGAFAGGIWNRMDSSNEGHGGFDPWIDTHGTPDGPLHLVLGSAGGAALGAIVGTIARRWDVLWPRSESPSRSPAR